MNNKFIKINKNIILQTDDILFVHNNYLITRFNINDKKDYKINKKEFINLYFNVMRNKDFILLDNMIINTQYLFLCQAIKNEVYLKFKRYKHGVFESRLMLASEKQAQILLDSLNKKINQ